MVINRKNRKRLDLLLVERGVAPSRQRAQALIMGGKVRLNEQILDKPGLLVSLDAAIAVDDADLPYVSRGGLKLEKAIRSIDLSLNGLTCLDVGASTGGFTDCLLQHGARRVFALDVGYGQLAWKLRTDPRVDVIERTNIRHLSPDALPCRVDLATIDVSFISLKIVVPAVVPFLKPGGGILALIKPQFEVGKGKVGKGGVVRDPAQHTQVIDALSSFFAEIGLVRKALIPSPILGPKGNREFVIYLENSPR